MKRRYKYRIYPTTTQVQSLAKLFGCSRVVWNDAVTLCQKKYRNGEKKPSNRQLQKELITCAKKTEERKWLAEVSNKPLQQSLNDLNQAFSNFFQSCKGERKDKPVKPPKFKSKHCKQSARFTRGGFKVHQHNVYLAKRIPTSQTCSTCGFNGGKKDLSVRGWTCLNCSAEHDRDINAAVNIKLAGGQSEIINERFFYFLSILAICHKNYLLFNINY